MDSRADGKSGSFSTTTIPSRRTRRTPKQLTDRKHDDNALLVVNVNTPEQTPIMRSHSPLLTAANTSKTRRWPPETPAERYVDYHQSTCRRKRRLFAAALSKVHFKNLCRNLADNPSTDPRRQQTVESGAPELPGSPPPESSPSLSAAEGWTVCWGTGSRPHYSQASQASSPLKRQNFFLDAKYPHRNDDTNSTILDVRFADILDRCLTFAMSPFVREAFRTRQHTDAERMMDRQIDDEIK